MRLLDTTRQISLLWCAQIAGGTSQPSGNQTTRTLRKWKSCARTVYDMDANTIMKAATMVMLEEYYNDMLTLLRAGKVEEVIEDLEAGLLSIQEPD